jgi:hypothetical protein
MVDADDLINDLQEYLESRQPVYLRKLDRLHPDKLIYRMLLVLDDQSFEIKELKETIRSQEDALEDLEGDIARLENEVNR